MKTQKTIEKEVRYIPHLLLSALTNANDYKRINDLYVMLDMIYRKQMFFKNNRIGREYGYVNISYSAFRELISKTSNITSGLEYLESKGYLIINHHYLNTSSKSFTKSYMIDEKYLSKKVPVEITDRNINKKIAEQRKNLRKEKVTDLREQQKSYFKTFKIDKQAAYLAIRENTITNIKRLLNSLEMSCNDLIIDNIIDSKGDYKMWRGIISQKEGGKEIYNIMHKMMLAQLHVNSIADGFLYFKKNEKTGRLYSNLTNLPSYLRKFVISTEKLVNIDIKNSQPFFMYTTLLGKEGISGAELERYGNAVISGELYELFGSKYREITGTQANTDSKKERDFAKTNIFKVFFSKTTSYAKEKAVFRSLFPSIMGHIDETNRVDNATLSLQMQNIESHFITKTVMKRCEKEGIIPLTIHDSVLCGDSDAPTVLQILNDEFQASFGVVPCFHYLYLMDDDNTEDIEIDYAEQSEEDAEQTRVLDSIFGVNNDFLILENDKRSA